MVVTISAKTNKCFVECNIFSVIVLVKEITQKEVKFTFRIESDEKINTFMFYGSARRSYTSRAHMNKIPFPGWLTGTYCDKIF